MNVAGIDGLARWLVALAVAYGIGLPIWVAAGLLAARRSSFCVPAILFLVLHGAGNIWAGYALDVWGLGLVLALPQGIAVFTDVALVVPCVAALRCPPRAEP